MYLREMRKIMKVLLVRPNTPKQSINLQSFMICEPLELEYVASALQSNGVEVDLIDMLLDPDNESPVQLQSGDGSIISFDQIAVIPYQDELYAILKPITHIEGVGDDEALVFKLFIEEDSLEIVNDFDLCDAVFDVYYDLLKQENFN